MRSHITPNCKHCGLEADWRHKEEIMGIQFGVFWCYVCSCEVPAVVEEPESI